MGRRIKIFEDFTTGSDLYNNIKECFQDLIDDGIVELEIVDNEIDISFEIKAPQIDTNDVHEFFEEKEKEFKFLNEIRLCLKRVEAMSEDIQTTFSYQSDDDGSGFLEIFVGEGLGKSGEFYKIRPNGDVKLNFKKIKELIGLPPHTNVYMSSGPTIYFGFKTKEELDKYKDQVLAIIPKFKIEDDNFIVEFPQRTLQSVLGKNEEPIPVWNKIRREHNTGRKNSYPQDIVNDIEFALNKKYNYDW